MISYFIKNRFIFLSFRDLDLDKEAWFSFSIVLDYRIASSVDELLRATFTLSFLLHFVDFISLSPSATGFSLDYLSVRFLRAV